MQTSATEALTRTWPVRRVGLKIHNLSACLDYYTRLGFTIVRDERDEGRVGLGVGSQELLSLRVLPAGKPRPARTAGLYHFAILLPDDGALGSFIQHCVEQQIPLEGASDHRVSQALYLHDPEGNGIEVYADRPRSTWQWKDGNINMPTLPLDAQALLRQAHAFTGFPPGTLLGHMHLNVGDLERSKAFYQNLGLEPTVDLWGQASFLSWGKYHHHLGINLWEGRRVRPMEPDILGLDFFEVCYPGLAPHTAQDPDGMTVIVVEAEKPAGD